MLNASLPQLHGGLFLSDGGLETTLIYLRGIALPHFAAFVLLHDEAGHQELRAYYEPYLALAQATPGAGFVLETPTWRANPDWGQLLGYDAAALARANGDAVRFVSRLREAWRTRVAGPIVLSGIIGPRGDGYLADAPDSAAGARAYHQAQVESLKTGGVDMLSAVTMTSSTEAIGIARAAHRAGLPLAVSFTVETDGRLPSGQTLRDAIEAVDADTPPAYFAINCAHPRHLASCFDDAGPWVTRIRGLRANASARSHAELDAATELDIGDPADLGGHYRRLRTPLRCLNVLGGCCGTDARHLRAIRDAWIA